MRCPICGREVENDILICPKCGTDFHVLSESLQPAAPVSSAASAAPEIKSKPYRKLLWLLPVCIVALCILVVVFWPAPLENDCPWEDNDPWENDYLYIKHYCTPINNPETGELSLRYDARIIPTGITLDGVISGIQPNMDGSTVTFTVASSNFSKNDLYCVFRNQVSLVAENILSYQISVNGKGIVYVTNDEKELYLYQVESGKTETLAKLDRNENIASLLISPDGQSAAYMMSDSENIYSLMVYKGGTLQKYARFPLFNTLIAMSNDCKVYLKIGTMLYYMESDGELQPVIEASKIRFNADNSQLLLESYQGTYISENGGAPQLVLEAELNPLLPANAQIFQSINIPVTDLYEQIYTSPSLLNYTNVWYISRDPEIQRKLAHLVSNVTLDIKGKNLYYIIGISMVSSTISHSILCKVDIDAALERAPSTYPAPDAELAKLVTKYFTSSDCSVIYYVSGEKLYRTNASDSSDTAFLSFISGYTNFTVDRDNVLYYLDHDKGVAYACGPSGEPKVIANDVTTVYSSTNGFVFLSSMDHIYLARGLEAPEEIL